MGLNRQPIGDLALGINKAAPYSELRPGEATGLTKNVEPYKIQGIRQRPGLSVWAADAQGLELHPGGYAISNIFQYERGGPIFLSLAGDIYWSPAGSPSFTKIYDNLNALGNPVDSHAPWHFVYARDGVGADTVWAQKDNSAGNSPKRITSAGVITTWTAAPKGVGLEWWRGRLVIPGGEGNPEAETLFYSDMGNPSSPTPGYGNNFIQLRTGIAEPLTAVKAVGELLLVFKEHSVIQVYDINTFANRVIGTMGAWRQMAVDVLKGRCYFLGPGGLWSTDAVNPPRLESVKVPELDLVGSPGKVASPYMSVRADHDMERVLIVVGSASDGAADSQTDTWSYYPPGTKNNPRKEGTFWRHDFDVAAFAPVAVASGGLTEYVLLAGAASTTSNAIVWRWDESTAALGDGGLSIDSHWETVLRFQEVEPFERLRRLNVHMYGQPVGVTVKDLQDASVKFSGSFAPTYVASPPNHFFSYVRPEARARDFLVELSKNVLDETWGVEKFEAVYRGGREHVG